MNGVLDVYLFDRLAGQLIQNTDGRLTFTYASDYLSSGQAQKISISMPLSDETYQDNKVRPYFSGLLPDERARTNLAKFLGISDGNSFGLLEVVGGECAGALTLYPQGKKPLHEINTDLEVLSEDRLTEILTLLHDRPLMAGEEGVRLSLAGVQDKLAVCLVEGNIALAKGGAPTTHILKSEIQELDGSVENEVFCMKLAKRMGLEVPHAQLMKVREIPYYLVERYDRIVSNGITPVRLHQEDFCQALSIPPELKYEDEGGPGVDKLLDALQQHSARPAVDRLHFIRMLIFHYLIGNADAHGKNYSFLYRNSQPSLAPVYDVLCTAAYPALSKRLAMKIGKRDVPDTIQLEHWQMLVSPTKTAQTALGRELLIMAERIISESEMLREELESQYGLHGIYKTICGLIHKRSSHILLFFN